MSSVVKTYEFRPSPYENNSLCIYRTRTFKGEVIGEDMGRLYRYQGKSNGVPVYRDVDGNFKPLESLTIDTECF